MPILSFCMAIAFFLVINLFLALFLASIVSLLLKANGVTVETLEMNFVIFLVCACVWIGIRLIFLNYYTFENFATIFVWPMNEVMPRDIMIFLKTSTQI